MPARTSCLLLVSLLSLIYSQAHSSCLCTAFQSSCWPDLAAWNDFNSSIDGRLLRVLPPAAPCHDDHFDQQACDAARNQWASPFWRSDQPGAMQASNLEANGEETCFISSPRNSSCSQGSVPVYAVSALTPSHVQAAVKFASARNIRLVIKNTGHDFFGKSTAAGSLSIWTHNMKNMSFHDDFVTKKCRKHRSGGPVSAVTVGAGVQWEELYQAVNEQNKVIVGGSCSTVGAAGGYVQGGGNGPLVSTFGLAADNVLEYEVVTATGEVVTANSCQNEDLFWALRGGGGGTFGAVVSATLRTHPQLENLVAISYNISFTDGSSLRDLLKAFSSSNPSLSDAGWAGTFTLSGPTFVFSYVLVNKDELVANKSLAPFLDYVERHPGLQIAGSLITLSSFEEWRLRFLCNGGSSCNATSSSYASSSGIPVAMSSRLIPRSLLHDPMSVEKLSQALTTIVERYPVLVSGLLAGGVVAKPRERNAVTPAWRQALWLVVISSSWNDGATLEEQREVARNVTNANKLLIDLSPGSGTYMNEADYNEPNWQQSFFGRNYPRLVAIKRKMDPSGLFRCHHCVGSERWSEDLNCDI